jgi:hypothetical protein
MTFDLYDFEVSRKDAAAYGMDLTQAVATLHDGEDLYFDEYEFELPIKHVTCWRCSGSGSHVNPGIDGGGLTAEDFHEAGPDFEDAYFGGAYDVSCYECGGSGKLEEVRADKLPAWLRSLYEERLEDDYHYAAMCAAERRYGC